MDAATGFYRMQRYRVGDFFTRDKHAAACEYWYEMHKGIHELLREYPV